MSIRCRDSNSRPSEHKSAPITTRPGLPPDTLSVFTNVGFTMKVSESLRLFGNEKLPMVPLEVTIPFYEATNERVIRRDLLQTLQQLVDKLIGFEPVPPVMTVF